MSDLMRYGRDVGDDRRKVRIVVHDVGLSARSEELLAIGSIPYAGILVENVAAEGRGGSSSGQ
jgi:hypothetical protein